MKQGKTEKAVFAKLSKVELEQHKVELAMVQDILKDYEIMQGQLKSMVNIASRRAYNYDEVIDMANKVGVDMDAKFKEAGEFFKRIERIKL